MKSKIVAILMSLYVVAGCSSSGGTDGGAGGQGTTGVSQTGLLISAILVSSEFSIDTSTVGCGEGEESGLTSIPGTFTVTYKDIVDTTGGLFPVGITLETYTVSYAGQIPSSPKLSPRTFGNTVVIEGAQGTAAIPVVIIDITTINEFSSQKGGSFTTHSYRVTVTYRGRTLAGDPIQVVASTSIELGNFDRCEGGDPEPEPEPEEP